MPAAEEASVDIIDLPEQVIKLLKLRGISKLTPPQVEALRKGFLKGNSLLVVAPTASGKTLVGELALINAYLNGGKGVYVTPLKALAEEKYWEFKYWERLGLRVGITTGDYDEPGEYLRNYDVIVATYERMDSIFRLKPSWLREVKTLVIDEFHMISDEDRGPIVEFLSIRSLLNNIQLIGLSATVGNPDELGSWLNAEVVISNWRPVRLVEGFYSAKKNTIIFEDGREEPVNKKMSLPHHCYRKAYEDDYQLLIFVQSRPKAEELARKLSTLSEDSPSDVKELIHELSNSEIPKVEVESLSKLLIKGVAYHHAGLSYTSRQLIERAFRERLLRAVVATPTLAAGINVPARRVLIYTRRFEEGFMKPISVSEYKQMAGRAGRPQYDQIGEAVIADVKSEEEGWHYIRSMPEDVKSQLATERATRIHTLALIASNEARNITELTEIYSKSLASRKLGIQTANYMVKYSIKTLERYGMIENVGNSLKATALGAIVSKLYIDPLTAVILLNNLRKILTAKPLYYLVSIAMTPDFSRVRITNYRQLAEDAEAALELGLIPEPHEGIDYYEWLRAFKIGRVLNAWIEEIPEDRIISEYGIGSGDLRVVVDSAEWLTYAAQKICEVEKLKEHSKNLQILNIRVSNGVKEELVELVKVKGVGRVRARALYEAGIKTIKDLAEASPTKIANLRGFGIKTAEEIINEAKKLLSKTL